LNPDRPPLIITDNRSFRAHLSKLSSGDTVVGLLNIKPTEQVLFLDLVERGIRLFPPALAQQLSRSKCLQAMVYREYMVPHTFVARDRHDMIKQINAYGLEKIGPVVTKQDRFNCGLGVHLWSSIEEAYNQACFGSLNYPFVVQPYVETAIDVRVVIIGDYSEAYWRRNPHSFRNNMFFGGDSGEYELSSVQWVLCRNVMERGKFPNAHIDLIVTTNGTTYFGEINLRGGLKGAGISGPEYQERIKAMEKAFVKSVKEENG
jgi:glutathione synthase/RimK-type ligase-like ATP-grasp enzyme